MNNNLTISLSFDDGRIDNYENVLKVLNTYNLKATIHVISGYVDGSYNKVLSSSRGPCSVEQLKEMKQKGFEISLHGDKHDTNYIDYNTCIKKMRNWDLLDEYYGFSVPHSDEKKLNQEFIDNLKKTKTRYIRVGKNIKKLNLKYKIFYFLSEFLNSSLFFNLYNDINTNKFENIDFMKLNSVIIRRKIPVKILFRFIKRKLNTNEWIIFMFHSVLDENDPLLYQSDWAWSLNKFITFCKYLSELRDEHKIKIDTIINIVGDRNEINNA